MQTWSISQSIVMHVYKTILTVHIDCLKWKRFLLFLMFRFQYKTDSIDFKQELGQPVHAGVSGVNTQAHSLPTQTKGDGPQNSLIAVNEASDYFYTGRCL